MLPLLTVVTANRNGAEHLRRFLESIHAQGLAPSELEFILVDNGSVDESVGLVRRALPEARVIVNANNEGFARASNQGAAEARGRYVAFLNNDLRLGAGWVRAMLDKLESSSEGTVCTASRVLSWDGATIDFADAAMAFNGIGFQPGFGSSVSGGEDRGASDELLFADGAAMLIDREVFLAAAGFDEDYFAYYEDVDLGWRLWTLGYRVVLCPDAVAYHRHGGSRGTAWRKRFLLERNALFSVLKNYEEASLAMVLPAALMLASCKASACLGVRVEEFAPGAAASRRAGAIGRLRTALRAARPSACEDRWREGLATLAAVDAVAASLPRVMKKRARIQASRRRSDREIAPLFKTPFAPLDPFSGRTSREVAVLWELGVVEYFQSLLEESPSRTSAARAESAEVSR